LKLAENQEKQFKALNDTINRMATKQEEKALEAKDTLKAVVSEKLSDDKFIESIEKGNKERIAFKSPIVVSNTATIEAQGSASQTSLTTDTGIVSVLRKRLGTYLENVMTGTLDVETPFSMWMEELDEQGNPTFVSETGEANQLSVRYEERVMKAKTVSVFGVITKDFMRYSSKLVNYVQNNLMKRLALKMEDDLFDGDGQGNTLNGVLSYASAYTGGGLKVDKPTETDVLRGLLLQVFKAHGQSSLIFVRPEIIAQLDVQKDEEGRYNFNPIVNGNQIKGVRLVETTALNGTDFDFVGGDMSAVNVEFLLDLEMEIYRDNDPKTRNFNIVLEQQLTQFVSANDTQVLVKGTMATAKGLIETT
jgi:HK97 family phage major capsid protein